MIRLIPFGMLQNGQPVDSGSPGKGSGIIGRRCPLSVLPGNILF